MRFPVWPLCLAFVRPALAAGPVPANVSVCFVPGEPCSAQIVAAIDGAQTKIRVQAYGFTSPPILAALVRAKRRGVDVAVVLDKSNAKQTYPGATFVANAGIREAMEQKTDLSRKSAEVRHFRSRA